MEDDVDGSQALCDIDAIEVHVRVVLRGALLWVSLSVPLSTQVAAQDSGAPSAHPPQARGNEAFRKAVERLHASDPKQRALAADEMGRRGHRFRHEISELLRPLLLSDPDATVRAASGRALGRLGAREAVPDLIKALSDKSADVRVVAAAALWRLPDPSATPALLTRVHDAEKAVREWAVLALGVIGDPRAVPETVRLLEDPERNVRLAAVRSAGRLGSSAALEPLVQFLKSNKRDREEKDEAVAALASIKSDERTPALLALLQSSAGDPALQLSLIAALGKVGTAAALPALRKLATSGPPAARDVATKAFAEVTGRSRSDKSPSPDAPRGSARPDAAP